MWDAETGVADQVHGLVGPEGKRMTQYEYIIAYWGYSVNRTRSTIGLVVKSLVAIEWPWVRFPDGAGT